MAIEWHGKPRWNYWNCQEVSAVHWRILEVKRGGTVAGTTELLPTAIERVVRNPE